MLFALAGMGDSLSEDRKNSLGEMKIYFSANLSSLFFITVFLPQGIVFPFVDIHQNPKLIHFDEKNLPSLEFRKL